MSEPSHPGDSLRVWRRAAVVSTGLLVAVTALLPVMTWFLLREPERPPTDAARRLCAWILDHGVPTPYAAEDADGAATTMALSLAELRSRVGAAVRALAQRAPDAADTARERALVDIARYALGEIPLTQVAPVDAESRFQLGWLLWRERQFERALPVWHEVRDDYRVQRALHEFVALRAQVGPVLPLWPCAVEPLLRPDATLAAAVTAEVRARLQPPAPAAGVRAPVAAEGTEAEDPLQRLVGHRTFRFDDLPVPCPPEAPLHLTLQSSYSGPLRLRWFAVPDLDALEVLDAQRLPTARLVRDAEVGDEPMRPVARQPRQRTLVEPGLPPGCYVAVAEARYCPLVAVLRVVVSDLDLLLEAGRNRVVVAALDRTRGTPRSDAPLRLSLEAHGDGTSAPVALVHEGRTGRDGLLIWDLATSLTNGREYAVTAESCDPRAPQRTRVGHRPQGAREIRAVVWTDRTLYRPGDAVAFAGVVRRRNGEALLPAEAADLRVEFARAGDAWVTAPCSADAQGTLHGTWVVPQDARLGNYRVRVAGASAQAVFAVQEFRPAEFAVTLRHPDTVRAGTDVDLAVVVRRFDGEPLPHAQVRLLIATRRHADDQASRSSWDERSVVSLTTDAEGTARHRLATPAGQTTEFAFQALVLDPTTLREATGGSLLRALVPGADLRVVPDRPRYVAGETAQLRICAAEPEVLLSEPGLWPQRFERKVPLIQGVGVCAYPIPPQARPLHVGVWDGHAWVWQPVTLPVQRDAPGSGLSVALDRAVYRPGDVATVRVRGDGQQAAALLLVATGDLHHARMLDLSAGDAVVEVPVTAGFVPEVHVQALACRGGQLHTATTTLAVPAECRRLAVAVAGDRPEYRPGDPCQVQIEVRDPDGQPVADALVSLAVADEAVLTLATVAPPGLLATLHGFERPLGLATGHRFAVALPASWLWKVPVLAADGGLVESNLLVADVDLERFSERGTAIGAGGHASHSGASQIPAPLRADFRATAYWAAALRTDAAGRVSAAFALPDTVGAWRATARVVAASDAVGEAQARLVVRQPFVAQVLTPRVFVAGDTVTVPGLLHNQTDAEVVVDARFASSLPLLRGAEHAALRVAAGGVARVECQVRVTTSTTPATIELRAAGATCGDAVRVAVPWRPDGVPFRTGAACRIEPGATARVAVPVPPDARRSAMTLRVAADGSLEQAVLAAVDELVAYPYGCVEQTMSRFLPAVAAAAALGARPHPLRDQLPAVLAAGLERLRALQHDDGGFGWWRDDPTHDVMTAYVVFGLARCQAAGTAVPVALAGRAAVCLATRLARRSGPEVVRLPHGGRCDVRVFMAHALTLHQRAFDRPPRVLAADLAASDLVLDRLLLAQIGAPAALPETSTDPVELAALIECRVARGEPVARQVAALLALRRGPVWRTTLESAYAVLALARVLPPTPEPVRPGAVVVRIAGQPPVRVDLATPVALAVTVVGAADSLAVALERPADQAVDVVVTLSGLRSGGTAANAPGLRIARRYWTRASGGWVPASDRLPVGSEVLVGLCVTAPSADAARSFVMVTDPRPAGFEPIDEAPLRQPPAPPPGPARLVPVARLARFRAACARAPEQGPALAAQLLAEVAALADAEPAATASWPRGTVPDAREQRDDRMVAFCTTLVAGDTWIYYRVRVECEGSLLALPPAVEPMYAPELGAVGVAHRWQVGELDSQPPATGLAAVAAAIGPLAPEALLAALDEGSVALALRRLLTPAALRQWLELPPPPAGSSLGEQLQAERARLVRVAPCLDGAALPAACAPVLAAALADDRTVRRVVETALGGIGDADSLLLWADDERAFRADLLAALQRSLGTRELAPVRVRAVAVPALLTALGARAPTGDARVRWLLAQRIARGPMTLADVVALCRRDLGLDVAVEAEPPRAVPVDGQGTVRAVLERALADHDWYYTVRGGVLRLGSALFVARDG